MIAFVPLLFAGIASILIEQVWYSPYTFGPLWVHLTNVSPEQIERGKRHTWGSAFAGLLTAMLVAYAMARIGIAFGISDGAGALELGASCWFGFCVPTLLTQVLWDQKPVRLFLLNAGYWLVAFVVMAFILFYTSALVQEGSYGDQGSPKYVVSQ